LQRSGQPEDVAAAVRYFLEAPYVTGQVLAIDGGWGLI
jgi:pteridine reductase